MPVQFQTAFVPKKTPITALPRPGFGRSVNVFGIVALIIFFLTAGLAGAVYFYKSHLLSTIKEMDASVAKARKSFEPEFIDEAARLNARIEGAQQLLNAHTVVSPIFDMLEKKTLESVRFRDFSFASAGGGLITLAMTGEGKSFNAIALQSDVFGAEPSFQNPVFSNFTLNDSGDVIFNFTATVNPDALRYRETVLGKSPSEEKADGAALDEDQQ